MFGARFHPSPTIDLKDLWMHKDYEIHEWIITNSDLSILFSIVSVVKMSYLRLRRFYISDRNTTDSLDGAWWTNHVGNKVFEDCHRSRESHELEDGPNNRQPAKLWNGDYVIHVVHSDYQADHLKGNLMLDVFSALSTLCSMSSDMFLRVV
jgi:hypothetical protein